MDTEILTLASAALLVWVALVHLVMAFGVRMGELVWGGRYPRLLPPQLRRRSLGYAILLLVSAWVLAALGGVVDFWPVSERWQRSVAWVVAAFLALAGIASLLRGSRWERMLFAPITLLGAALAGWFTFS